MNSNINNNYNNNSKENNNTNEQNNSSKENIRDIRNKTYNTVTINNETETIKKGLGIKKFTVEDIQRAKKVEIIINNCKDYIERDPVDLYLKSRNITNDTKIYYDDYVRTISMVNIYST